MFKHVNMELIIELNVLYMINETYRVVNFVFVSFPD